MKNNTNNSRDDLWAYSKLAYWLDVAEVIWPLVDNIRSAKINTTDQLLKEFTGGKFKEFSHATKRGIKQVANLLMNLYHDERDEVMNAYQLYVG